MNINNTNLIYTQLQQQLDTEFSKISISDFLQSLCVGQTFTAEVTERIGQELQILLANGQTFTATQKGPITQSIGDQCVFEVIDNSNNELILKNIGIKNPPVIEETAQKALDQAGLLLTPKNVTLVSELLKQNMSIDKKNLTQIFRQTLAIPEQEIPAAVTLVKEHIPLTQPLAEQLYFYQKDYPEQTQLPMMIHACVDQVLYLSEHISPKESEVFIPLFTSTLLKDSPITTTMVNEPHNAIATKLPLKVLEDTLLKEFFLNPEQLKSKEKVTEYYHKLEDRMTEFESALKLYAKEIPTVTQTLLPKVSQLLKNISFMRSVNEVFGYIQLPVHIQKNLKNAELYVCSNKKTRKTSEDMVHVLLHLNMTHLGPLDFYLSMQRSFVNAKISMTNEDSLRFLSTYLSELTGILEKRNFHFTYELETVSKESNPIKDHFFADTQKSIVHRYTFDAHA